MAFLCVPTPKWLSQTSSDPESHPHSHPHPILIHIHSFNEYLPNAFGMPRGHKGSAPDDATFMSSLFHWSSLSSFSSFELGGKRSGVISKLEPQALKYKEPTCKKISPSEKEDSHSGTNSTVGPQKTLPEGTFSAPGCRSPNKCLL